MNKLFGKYINIEFKDEYIALPKEKKIKVINDTAIWLNKEARKINNLEK